MKMVKLSNGEIKDVAFFQEQLRESAVEHELQKLLVNTNRSRFNGEIAVKAS